MGSRHDRITVIHNEDHTWLSLGAMEIWDGADLSLIRDTLTALLEDGNVAAIVMDLGSVKYIPSGFFGMLCEWSDRGVRVEATQPKEKVAAMLWFRHFFRPVGEGRYLLEPASAELMDDEHSEDDLAEDSTAELIPVMNSFHGSHLD